MATCFKRSSSSDNRTNKSSSSSSASTAAAASTSSKIAALHQQQAAGDAEAAAVAAAAYAAANEAHLVVELVCPVCQGLLREPVSLPCGHNLCLACLRASVEHSSLNCPLCRQRLGSWFRSTTKSSDTNLVNHDLWRLIRATYPPAVVDAHDLVHHRNHRTQVVDHHHHHLHRVIPSVPDLKSKKISASGEIRKEYEVKLQQAKERMRQQDEIERLASEALMRQIYNEEEQKKLLQLAKDQLLARTLANEDMYARKRPERTAKTIAIANWQGERDVVRQPLRLKYSNRQHRRPAHHLRNVKNRSSRVIYIVIILAADRCNAQLWRSSSLSVISSRAGRSSSSQYRSTRVAAVHTTSPVCRSSLYTRRRVHERKKPRDEESLARSCVIEIVLMQPGDALSEGVDKLYYNAVAATEQRNIKPFASALLFRITRECFTLILYIILDDDKHCRTRAQCN
ncbi:unnamed protein product, partial [Trichogramma brassicae]